MTVNVIYFSRRGTTARVADAIGKVCGVEAMDVSTPHTIGETDLLFIGMGIYAGRPDPALLSYLDNLPVNSIKGAAVFSLSASGTDHTATVINMLEHKGITVYPKHLMIRGRFLFLNKNHPDEKDIRKAEDFAKEVLSSFQG